MSGSASISWINNISAAPNWANINIVAEGDSLTDVDYNTSTWGVVAWPSQFATALPDVTITNFSEGGDRLALDINTTDQRNAVNAAYNANKTHNILVVWAGANDLNLDSGLTPQELYDIVEDYATTMKSAQPGWIIVYVTMLWRTWPSESNVTRDAFNALIVANPPVGVDIVADVDAIIVDKATNPDYYEVDDVHLDTSAHTVAYTTIRAAIEEVI